MVDNLSIAGEQTQGMNLTLDVGVVSETVIVSGDDIPPLDTETGNISGTLNSQEIQNLPSFSRDPFQLLRLAPGVFGDGAHGGGARPANTPRSQEPRATSAPTTLFHT